MTQDYMLVHTIVDNVMYCSVQKNFKKAINSLKIYIEDTIQISPQTYKFTHIDKNFYSINQFIDNNNSYFIKIWQSDLKDDLLNKNIQFSSNNKIMASNHLYSCEKKIIHIFKLL